MAMRAAAHSQEMKTIKQESRNMVGAKLGLVPNLLLWMLDECVIYLMLEMWSRIRTMEQENFHARIVFILRPIKVLLGDSAFKVLPGQFSQIISDDLSDKSVLRTDFDFSPHARRYRHLVLCLPVRHISVSLTDAVPLVSVCILQLLKMTGWSLTFGTTSFLFGVWNRWETYSTNMNWAPTV